MHLQSLKYQKPFILSSNGIDILRKHKTCFYHPKIQRKKTIFYVLVVGSLDEMAPLSKTVKNVLKINKFMHSNFVVIFMFYHILDFLNIIRIILN